MKNYISVNIVPQALLLLTAMREHSCNTREKVSQLKTPYGVNKASALAFARQCQWIADGEEKVTISAQGIRILDGFSDDYISQPLWKAILGDYIVACQPAWARRIPYGRKEAFLIMNEEEQRCFVEAGLIESIDTDVIEWWDELAEKEREKVSSENNETGRNGEKLTIDYEKKRTGRDPYWAAVESNLAGYDISSVRSPTDNDQILIEVKTSTQAPGYAACIITRHEWDTATRGNNTGRYYFYLWWIRDGVKMLATVSVAEMANQIPSDMNQGKWENVRVPFSAYEDRFSLIE